MKTYVYIDAFNLYYGSLKGTNFKWLDLEKLCKTLLPDHNIQKIKYFTAKVSSRPDNPDTHIHQDIYLKVLSSNPLIEIFYGHFLTHAVPMRLANPPKEGSPYVKVLKTEEKGSDVNIASHLVHDAHLKKFECAVVISGDSDLLSPILILKNELNLPVGVINPQKRVCRVLANNATFYKKIRQGVIALSQFPDSLTINGNTINKPKGW